MEPAREVLKKDLQQLTGQLKTLRDEVRVQMHLAEMDAKDVWQKLEPEVEAATALAQKASADSVIRAKEVLARLRKFQESLKKEPPKAGLPH